MMLNGVAVDCRSMRALQAPHPPSHSATAWDAVVGGVRKARVVRQVPQMKENYIYCLRSRPTNYPSNAAQELHILLVISENF